ncbi:MAG: hypothetical protein AMJ62_04950 [Myxococcales bacterium SG8_38]|nr:MAG: hypothetical protein AMJ62_04950 [Myxococcales bacterium SG8_38]
MMEDAPAPRSRNVGLWVGLGCLGTLVLSCCLFTYWAQAYGWRVILTQGDETKMWASRTILVGALGSSAKSCKDGAIGDDALPWFHPDMPAESRDRVCALDEAALRRLGTPEQSSTSILHDTDRAEMAARFGMDPALCFEHSTDDVSAVGCFDPSAETGTIPYQIIDLTVRQP